MNFQILKSYISEYKREFDRIHDQEIYKWQAVKHFQDFWSPESPGFAKMIEEALSKTGNLLVAGSYYPRGMIIELSQEEPTK